MVKVTEHQKEQLEAIQREKSHQGSEVRVKVTEHQKVMEQQGTRCKEQGELGVPTKEQLEAVQREKSHQGSEVRVKVTEQLMATSHNDKKSTEGTARGRTEREIKDVKKVKVTQITEP